MTIDLIRTAAPHKEPPEYEKVTVTVNRTFFDKLCFRPIEPPNIIFNFLTENVDSQLLSDDDKKNRFGYIDVEFANTGKFPHRIIYHGVSYTYKRPLRQDILDVFSGGDSKLFTINSSSCVFELDGHGPGDSCCNRRRDRSDPTDCGGTVMSVIKLKSNFRSAEYVFAYDPLVFDRNSIVHIIKMFFH